MAIHWRLTDSYIRCTCDGISMSQDESTVFKYRPVIGEGYIEIPGCGVGDWGDNVIPIKYDRFKTRVELLRDLGYSVMFIATKLGTTEEEVRKIVGKDYIHKDYSEMRSEYFMLINENSRLRDEVRSKKDEIETLEGNYKALRAKYNGVSATNVCGEDERKKLIEENARLSAALKSEEEANDILTKRITETEDEINELKERYRTLQAQSVGVCNEDCEKLTEEIANLTKQISDLRSAYDRIYRSRDEHIKHVEALECKVNELTTENEEERTIIKSLTEYKDSWREEALRYKEELATVKAKHADAIRCKNGLEYRVSVLIAEARDYKKRYEVAKSANSSLSDRYEKLITQRDMAIRLLFTTHDYDEIADALHISESRVIEIVKEGSNEQS